MANYGFFYCNYIFGEAENIRKINLENKLTRDSEFHKSLKD